jgi:hypothetical protein
MLNGMKKYMFVPGYVEVIIKHLNNLIFKLNFK